MATHSVNTRLEKRTSYGKLHPVPTRDELMSFFRQFFRSLLGFLLVCFAFNPALAQESAPPGAASEKQHVSGASALTPTARPAKFVISAGDLIEVSVYGVPELSQKTRVNASGELYMPLVGYTHVEGLTIADAQAVME